MCLKWSSQGKPPRTPELYGKHHSQHQLRQGTTGVHWHEPWLVGREQSEERESTVEPMPKGCFHLTVNMVEGATYWWPCRTCLLQFMGRLHGVQALKFGFLAPGCVQLLPTDLCAGKRPQIMQSRAHHHTRIITRTRTDRQTNQECHSEEAKQEEIQKNKEKGKGSIPLFSISWWLSVLQSQDFSCFSFFFLFFYFKEFGHSS